jgi:hypothetical protein
MIRTSHAPESVEQQRAQARILLESLEVAHRESEQTPAEPSNGHRDLFKKVTGHSSLENAIHATRRAIEAYDRMLAKSEEPARVPVIRVTATGVPSVL